MGTLQKPWKNEIPAPRLSFLPKAPRQGLMGTLTGAPLCKGFLQHQGLEVLEFSPCFLKAILVSLIKHDEVGKERRIWEPFDR